MTKDVLVLISGLQFEINEDEAIEVISAGEYYFRNEKHFIQYDEVSSEENGLGGITKNILKISEGQVEILKKGSSNVHMIFQENKKNMTYYNTPYGNLLVGIYTTSIKNTILEDKIVTKIQYSLEVNYTHVSECKITMQILSKS